MAGPQYDLSSANPADLEDGQDYPFAILDENGDTTESYTALKTMIQMIDRFDSVQELSSEQFAFTIGDQTIYVHWSSTTEVSGVEGNVTIVDLEGNETSGTVDDIPLDGNVYFITFDE